MWHVLRVICLQQAHAHARARARALSPFACDQHCPRDLESFSNTWRLAVAAGQRSRARSYVLCNNASILCALKLHKFSPKEGNPKPFAASVEQVQACHVCMYVLYVYVCIYIYICMYVCMFVCLFVMLCYKNI